MTRVVLPESLLNVLGVVYRHRKTSDGGDLYLTRYGQRHSDLLEVHNWYDRAWFKSQRVRLEGTSAVYRVPTKEIEGRRLDLVVKNCRVGEDVPVETRTLLDFLNAEFNSPWEEFSLVMEMRASKYGPRELSVKTQEPLAIYVPPEKMQLWQSGRSREKMSRIRARHSGIDLDYLRQYKLVYGWIRGDDVVSLLRDMGYSGEELIEKLEPLTAKAIDVMAQKGFAVADMKPDHIIIGRSETLEIGKMGPPGDEEATSRKSEFLDRLVDEGRYSIVDYELLLRTPEHEEEVSKTRRHSYLDDQRDRFKATELPSHLSAIEIFGVPYIFGHAESTAGVVWVMGRNARLFDYFLPERWRKTHSWLLSGNNEVFYTYTKDHVHVVWKTSRVGEDSARADDQDAALVEEWGYNSPFEEFAIAHDLAENGVPTVYVRAIYCTGSHKQERSFDLRRYESHRSILDPEGEPILREDRNYITLRGYYNGPDTWVAKRDGKFFRPFDLDKALRNDIVDRPLYDRILDATRSRVRNVGYDGRLLRGTDILLSLDPDGKLVKDAEGLPEARVCDFELIRKL